VVSAICSQNARALDEARSWTDVHQNLSAKSNKNMWADAEGTREDENLISREEIRVIQGQETSPSQFQDIISITSSWSPRGLPADG
jgi:hypothetical protein